MNSVKNVVRKKFGTGTSSLIISILSVMLSFSSIGGKEFGKHLLDFVNISFPISIISLCLFLISIYLGYRFKGDFGAKAGRYISTVFTILIIVLSIISLIAT